MFDRTDMVVLEKGEYKKLVETVERVTTLERFLKASSYVGIEDVKAILGIGEEKADG